MPDETALRIEAQRAERARALINDPLLTEMFNKLSDAYVAAWLQTSTGDSVGREKLYFAAKTLPAVRQNLETLMLNGSIAAKQLANLEDDAKRYKR